NRSTEYGKWPDWKPLYDTYRANFGVFEDTCAVYVRQSGAPGIPSYDGSWLLEYWFYYPFDLNGLDQHIHDTEHFVRRGGQAGRDGEARNRRGSRPNNVQQR